MISRIQNLNIFKSNPNREQKRNRDYYITSQIADDIFISKEKELAKKRKKTGIVLTSSVVGATLLALGLTKGLPKNTHKVLGNFLENVKKNTNSGKEKLQEKLKKGVEKAQSINNFNAFKDMLFQKMMEKFKFTGNIHRGITRFFEDMAQNTVISRYNSTHRQIKKLNKVLQKAGLPEEQLTKLTGKVDSISENFQQRFSKETLKSRFSNLTKSWEGLIDDVWDKSAKDLEGVKTSKTFKEGVESLNNSDVSNVFIAEEVLSGRKNDFVKLVSGHKDEVAKGLDELLEMSKEYLSPAQQRKLASRTKGIKGNLNKAAYTESSEYFDKVRDLKLGSAPTDVITMLTSVGMVGIGLSKADSKDERISAALKFGIPVLGSVFSSVLLTISLVSGFKAIAIGTALGLGMSVMGEKVDIARRKYNKKKEDELHANKVKEEIAKQPTQDVQPAQKLKGLKKVNKSVATAKSA